MAQISIGEIVAKKPSKLSKIGSPDAGVMYSLVGSALSYWEASDDELMGLFRWFCGKIESIAVATYTQAPRKVRISMLNLAIDTYGYRLTSEEVEKIRSAISGLNKLSSLRNEIAHGHVSEMNMSEMLGDGTQNTLAQGNYLLPSLNEGSWHERTFRFHHTADSILDFREEVREHRWTIIQVKLAASMRENEENRNAGSEFFEQRRIAVGITTRRIKPSEWTRYVRPMKDWPC